MNARERTLAILLILIMIAAAGGVAVWQLIWSPYKRHEGDITKLQNEIDELKLESAKVEKAVREYNTITRKKSLPAQVELSKREYSRMLTNMLRKSDFMPTDTKVIPRDPNTTGVPTLGPKKYAYTKLEFDVTVKGGLENLVDFMYYFYRQPLLHQITKLTIVKPAGARGRGGDLDVTMLVQAIALDKADDRGVLLASAGPANLLAGGAGSVAYSRRGVDVGFGSPFIAQQKEKNQKELQEGWSLFSSVLARVDTYQSPNPLEEYRRIAGKNVFYPPPPVFKKGGGEEPKEKEPRVKLPDVAPFAKLIGVYHINDGSAQAIIFDVLNKEYYEIEQDANNNVRIYKYWYSTKEENGVVYEIKKKVSDDDYDYRSLTFGSEATGNERAFRVRRILESDIIIEPYVAGRSNLMKYPVSAVLGGSAPLVLPGKLYRWHIGQVLQSGEEGGAPVELTATEGRYALLRALNYEGNTVEPPPKDEPKKKGTSKTKSGR